MAGSLELSENRYHVRSISMPSRSHPLALRVEEEFTRSRLGKHLQHPPWQRRLGHIRDLCDCVEDEKCVDELLLGQVRLLDMCAMTRDIWMSMKEHARTLQFALRRRGQELCIESKVDEYIRARKKVKEDIRKCPGELKQIESKCASAPLITTDQQHLARVVIVPREVRAITIAVLRAILSFMSASRPNQKAG